MLVIRCAYDLAICFNYEEENETWIASREKISVDISAGIHCVWPSDAMWDVTPEILVNPGPGAAFDWCHKVITWINVDLPLSRCPRIHSNVMFIWTPNIPKLRLKLTYLKSRPHLPWDNEFKVFTYIEHRSDVTIN